MYLVKLHLYTPAGCYPYQQGEKAYELRGVENNAIQTNSSFSGLSEQWDYKTDLYFL
jgi:hypothetical protein